VANSGNECALERRQRGHGDQQCNDSGRIEAFSGPVAQLAGLQGCRRLAASAAANEFAAIRFELHFGVEARLGYRFTSEAERWFPVCSRSTTEQECILVREILLFDE